jgi:hypothetical protein
MYYEPKRGFPFNIPKNSLTLFIIASKKFYVWHGGGTNLQDWVHIGPNMIGLLV